MNHEPIPDLNFSENSYVLFGGRLGISDNATTFMKLPTLTETNWGKMGKMQGSQMGLPAKNEKNTREEELRQKILWNEKQKELDLKKVKQNNKN